MKKINFKSDFDFVLNLKDSIGIDTIPLSAEWSAKLYTSQKVNAFVASHMNGVSQNYYDDNGHIHIVVDNHHLSPGVLKCEFAYRSVDAMYPDGTKLLVATFDTGIELIHGVGLEFYEQGTSINIEEAATAEDIEFVANKIFSEP